MMRIQRIIALTLVVIPMIAFSQSADKQAASLFSQGKYDDAAKLYDTAASTTLNDPATRQRFYELAEKCRKCSEYKNNGNSFYINKEYSKAKDVFNELLRLNPKDKKAENLIDSCDYYISLPFVEKALWDSAMVYKTEYYFKTYLKKFPNGTYRVEANNYLDDINLWFMACETNTVSSYENYYYSSQLHIFNDEARERIGQLQEDERKKEEQERLAQAERERVEREHRLAQEKRESEEAEKKRLAQVAERERLAQAEKERREKEKAEERDRFLDQARNFYQDGYYYSAISNFDKVGMSSLSAQDKDIYKKCKEEIAYDNLKDASGVNRESKYKQFLTEFPESKYYNTVSNQLSNYYVSQYDFINAQKYATDEETQAYVLKSKKQYDRAVKRASINNDEIYFGGSKSSQKGKYGESENQKWLRFGAGATYSKNEEDAFWGGQALFTIGSHRNYFNLDLGADYSEGVWGAFSGLKWNILRLDGISLYIGYQINLFDNPELYNIEIGNREFYSEEVITAGFQGRHFDLGSFYNYEEETFGAKLIIYF